MGGKLVLWGFPWVMLCVGSHYQIKQNVKTITRMNRSGIVCCCVSISGGQQLIVPEAGRCQRGWQVSTVVIFIGESCGAGRLSVPNQVQFENDDILCVW